MFLDQKSEIFKKSEKSTFSMVFVKKSNVFSLVFFGQIKPEEILF